MKKEIYKVVEGFTYSDMPTRANEEFYEDDWGDFSRRSSPTNRYKPYIPGDIVRNCPKYFRLVKEMPFLPIRVCCVKEKGGTVATISLSSDSPRLVAEKLETVLNNLLESNDDIIKLMK